MRKMSLMAAFASGAVAVAASVNAPVANAAETTVRDESGMIEEVVVTSRRREESQQDVPLSVTAFGEQQIEALKPKTLRDFDGLAPNLYVGMNTAGPSASAIFIRGVGYADIEKTQSPQVGVIVDGIQMGSSTGQLIDAFDIESIEINRGPQGVLFGRNTIGGNIVVNRAKPEFNEFGYKLNAEIGNYDSQIYKARFNVPLIDDQLALKIGGIKRARAGYYDNENIGGTVGDVDYEAFTAALRWGGEDFDATLTVDRIRDSSDTLPQDPRFDGDTPFVNLADKREPTSYDVDQVGLQFSWDINERVTLYSVTGYHDGHDKVVQDFDGVGVTLPAAPLVQLHTLRDQEFKVYTQELRLAVDITESVDVMVGAYYLDSELKFNQKTSNIVQVPFGLPEGVSCTTLGLRDNPNLAIGNQFCQFPNARSEQIAGEDEESKAVFGSVNFRPIEGLELSVGARYIDDEKEAFNSFFDYSDGTFDTRGTQFEHDFTGYPRRAGTAYQTSDSWNDTIAMASARYDLSEEAMVYASYSEGFRSGGFSIRSARLPSEAAFDPEEAFQWEVGVKSEWFDRRLRTNLAYFNLERDNGQFSSIITLLPGAIPGTTTLINNGGKSITKGLELEAQYFVTDELSIGVNAGYIDVENEAFAKPCDIIDGCGVDGSPSGTPRLLGGNDDSRQPEWNAAFTANYERQFGSGIFNANVGYRKFGQFLLVNTGAGADSRTYDGEYSLLDARVQYDWTMDDGSIFSVALFGKNLTDEEYREQALFLGAIPGFTETLPSGGPNTGFQGWGAPRTYAVEFTLTH
jgi:iron complex outermembrane receptor protein